MAEAAESLMSVEAFLDWEERQECRYELVAGRPRLMTGASSMHGEVAGGVYACLRSRLAGKPCRARAEFKVLLPNGNIRYPDVMVDCGPTGPKDVIAREPRVLVEVLSPSTQGIDYFTKLREYEQLASVSSYLVFSQDYSRATVFRKLGGRLDLVAEAVGVEAVIDLPEIGVELPLAEVYGDLGLSAS